MTVNRDLSSDGTSGALQLGDVLDASAVQSLMDEFHALTHIPVAVVARDGKVLVGAGWQDICTRFHRVHPETRKHCFESDTQLTAGVRAGEIKLYKCKNNMWDAATPIVVDGQQLGNVFTGQFFFEGEVPDHGLFRAQAARYGFPREGYLAALEAVPRLSRASVDAAMAFLLKFAGMLSRLGVANIRLARMVAEREALTASLREKTAQLEEADRRKDEFLGVLSHELRNPLAPIRNSVHVLRHAAPESDRAQRAQDVIARQTEHLARLVDDLLDVTRIARGKIELRRSRADLRDVVVRAADDFRCLMDERGLAFEVVVPAAAVPADVDETRVTQVLGNLLHNAAKFSRRGDAVTVELRAVDGRAEIAVRDTGAGIDAPLLPRVFDAFVQSERTLARSQGGLGLGLALVKGIAELHGGAARAASAGVGRGAEFTVWLPLAPAAISPEHGAPLPRTSTPLRVLVVDDNRDAAQSLADVVELLGHAAEVAHDGPSALERARAIAPDVVLCDIGLPGMSGYDVARALRATGRAMRLVAVSGYAQPEDVRSALEAGFDAHLAKPCDASQIERLLA